MAKDEKLTITGHLGEFRKRLMWSAIAVAITTAISFVFAKYIFIILESRAEGIELIYIEMTEMIGTYFKVALFSGLALATPVLIYETVMFIRPALSHKERRYLYTLLPGVLIAFVIGVLFAYFVLVPPAAKFLISFGSDIATPQIRVGNFISLMVRLIFSIGLCFELPIVVYFLTKIGVLTVKKLSRFRKFALIGAFIIGAIITPTPDPINQSIVALPLIALYEVGILLARIAQRGRKEYANEESAKSPS